MERQRPDGVLARSSSTRAGQRLVPIHERFGDDALACTGDGRDTVDVLRRQRERLLAQHVFPGVERAQRPLDVQRVGKRNVDGVDARIAQQIFVAAVRLRDLPFPARTSGRAPSCGWPRPRPTTAAPPAWPEADVD